MIIKGRQALSKFTLAAVVSSVLAASAVAQTRSYRFDIENEPLSRALRSYSQIAEQEIIFTEDVVAGAEAATLKGDFTPEQALEKLLEGTGLVAERSPSGAIMIRRPRAHTSETGVRVISQVNHPNAAAVRIARRSGKDETAAVDSDSLSAAAIDDGEDGTAEERISVEEILVTGSHIRGAQNLSSPVISFNRDEIEASGYSTTQQLFRSLPQSFNSISDTTANSVNGGAGWTTAYEGSGVNLRGLGGDATLVLINGRRVAGSGNGSFVDLSLIPLSAIERVDVLTDGASAIYGSDAVKGVVNFILRQDVEGAETRLRYGVVTEGGHDELQAGQMFGHAWQGGNAFVSFEYLKRTELDSDDRSFFSPVAYPSFQLIPQQERYGTLATFNQLLTNRIDISGDLFFAERESIAQYTVATPQDTATDVRQYGGSIGLNVALPREWKLRLTGLVDQNDSELRQFDRTLGVQTYTTGNESRMQSLDVAADGLLMSISGGSVSLALGSQLRREEFVEENSAYPNEINRQIAALYGEVRVPWVGPQNRFAGMERLELTLAYRYEDYSDFGSTSNPKLGLSWGPTEGLNIRGTIGTSFKAPLLTQLNPGNRYGDIYQGYFPDVCKRPPKAS